MSYKKMNNVDRHSYNKKEEPHLHDVVVGDEKNDHYHAMIVCDDAHKSDSFQRFVATHEKDLRKRFEAEKFSGKKKDQDKIETYQSYY
jgi:hypothetical protein